MNTVEDDIPGMISERQKLILFTVINEYIKHAEPVSSQLLYDAYDFEVSSATLRNEFAALEDEGYVFQPHTSSGRVPTDKGYRLFVDSLRERRARNEERVRSILRRIIELKKEEHDVFSELAKAIAALSGNAVFSGPLDARVLFKAGLNEVLSQPELADFDNRRNFGDVLDSFEDNVEEFAPLLDSESPAVFIGNENPIVNARSFSMVVSKCRTARDEEGIVVIFGPKRMNYKKNIEVLDTLLHLLS